jgi:hypothetical protein
MANTYTRKCSASLAMKRLQIKLTLRFYLTPVKMAIITKQTTNADKDAGENEHFSVG